MNEEKQNPSFNLTQELETLVSAVEKAAQARLGSFSQRNPLLGKMIRCPYCRIRRRENAQEPCCSIKYFVTVPGTAPPKSYMSKHRKNPRLTRHRPPLFLMRQRLLELEAEPLLVGPLQDSVEGLHGFWTPQVEVKPEHLATFVERVIIRELKQETKKKRKTQELSRKINRNLC